MPSKEALRVIKSNDFIPEVNLNIQGIIMGDGTLRISRYCLDPRGSGR